MLDYAQSAREGHPLRAPVEPVASCRFAHQLEQSNGRLDASDAEVKRATETARGAPADAMPAADTMAAPLTSTAAHPGIKEQPGTDPLPAKGVPVYVMLPLDTVRDPLGLLSPCKKTLLQVSPEEGPLCNAASAA